MVRRTKRKALTDSRVGDERSGIGAGGCGRHSKGGGVLVSERGGLLNALADIASRSGADGDGDAGSDCGGDRLSRGDLRERAARLVSSNSLGRRRLGGQRLDGGVLDRAVLSL